VQRPEWETAAKLTLAVVAAVVLILVISSSSWGPDQGFAPTDRSNSQYDEFAADLFVNHGFELVIMALIIAAAVIGGLQIAREEDYE
jgi:NADH:ubiquinone oxidoreductase subunit 6 (subunit J)